MASAERRIALCVGTWASDSTLYAWTYIRESLLRRVPTGNGTETELDPRDELFIVHVGDRAERRRMSTSLTNVRNTSWDAGGPITHSLAETLLRYKHTVVELQGNNLTSTILEWATENDVTLLVMGLREVKGSAMIVKKAVPGEWGIGSLSDAMLQHTKLPLLVVPADAVRCMGRVHLRSEHNSPPPHSSAPPSEQASSRHSRALSPPRGRLPTIQDEPTPVKPLRVAVVTEGRAGPEIMRWVARHLLQPADQVHLLHVLAKSDRNAGAGVPPLASASEAAAGQASFKSLERPDSPAEELLARDWGAEELQDFSVVSKAYLKGDAKDKLLAYVEKNPLDMLVIGRSLGNRLKMALTPGGTVSQHLVTRAPCPTLVLPYRALGLGDPSRGDFSPDQVASPRDSLGVGSGRGDDEGLHALTHARAQLQTSAPVQTEGFQRQDTPAPSAGLGSSEPTLSAEYFQHLTRQLSERDCEISALREQVRQLQVAAAQPVESIPE